MSIFRWYLQQNTYIEFNQVLRGRHHGRHLDLVSSWKRHHWKNDTGPSISIHGWGLWIICFLQSQRIGTPSTAVLELNWSSAQIVQHKALGSEAAFVAAILSAMCEPLDPWITMNHVLGLIVQTRVVGQSLKPSQSNLCEISLLENCMTCRWTDCSWSEWPWVRWVDASDAIDRENDILTAFTVPPEWALFFLTRHGTRWPCHWWLVSSSRPSQPICSLLALKMGLFIYRVPAGRANKLVRVKLGSMFGVQHETQTLSCFGCR